MHSPDAALSDMRILFVNDGIGDAGGVQSYLTSVAAAIRLRGHASALLHLDAVRVPGSSPLPDAPHFCVDEAGVEGALAAARAWKPDVVFSHNMRNLDVERGLFMLAPVVKMMHGYFGSCISGQKMHGAPRAVPCGRRLGLPCLALYAPRRCGVLTVDAMFGGYGRARALQAMFPRYAALMVASAHMRREYIRNGAHAERVVVNPLFANTTGSASRSSLPEFTVLFLARMTYLKGGDRLIRAMARASSMRGRNIKLVMAGDGPQRAAWEALATSLGVNATFTGWVENEQRDTLLRHASLLAMPSIWPEPFGLCGLEAGAFAVPAVAFDVGGIREWLHEGVNGRFVCYDSRAIESLATTIAELETSPSEVERLGEGARETATRMSVGAHVTRLELLLQRAHAVAHEPFADDPVATRA